MKSPRSDSTPTWYEAGLPAPQRHAPLGGDRAADIVVVGAGYTGLGAALHLAERGRDVVVLEKAAVGSGASGRNGGQLHTGQRREQDYLEKTVGADDAMRLWRLAEDAKANLKELIARHNIDCDWREGLVEAEHRKRFVPGAHAYARHLRDHYGYDQLETLDRDALQTYVRSDDYHGGVLDRGAAHLHPLKLARGMAEAAVRAGAVIHEDTEALEISQQGGVSVRTPHGTVRAQRLILAGDALMRGLDDQADSCILPIASTIGVTAPMGERLKDFLPALTAAFDSRFVVNYFRPTPDGRLLFGGGESYSTEPVANPGRLVRAAMKKVFPALADEPFDYAWSGVVGVTTTRLPLVRRMGNAVLAAGYSGQGLALAPYFGRLIAEAADQADARFDMLTRLPTPAFPGGAHLRWPLMVAAMSYFALRDRL
ncbi:oxidoreductase [Agaricicola taiwanensis]|uniref:Oxidoreductase n=1 Tax=Agaricicola taiwanensis TaxID=591372 RepID=A0A8J2YG67_9RHOB|nr:FAD-binding oxidoreductase [Agaricicola taiwanensis]GGE33908.1 oxidoreductase [Agaricicola taiwanensis]